MRVGIDLDGCIHNFGKSLQNYLETITHSYDCTDPQVWDFYKDWGMTDIDFKKHCNDGVDAGIVFNGPQFPGAVQAVRRIKAAGHSIHFITDRFFGSDPRNSAAVTEGWLLHHGFPYDSLTFSPDKTVVATDVFVEDKAENYDMLEATGVRCYLINQPWNIEKDNRRRISGMTEFADILTMLDQNAIL